MVYRKNTIYIAKTIWFGSERSNKNAAEQLNEALAIHYGIGDTDWLYKTGRVSRGGLKVVGGAAGVVSGVVLCKTGAGAILGVPLAAVGGSGVVEGFTQVFGGGAGENGWNPLEEMAAGVGGLVGGDKGERITRIGYRLVDISLNVAGGVAAVKAASGVQRYEIYAKFKLVQGQKVLQWKLADGTIYQMAYKVKVPFKLRMTGHLIEASESSWEAIQGTYELDKQVNGSSNK